jgi:hypothetical protein
MSLNRTDTAPLMSPRRFSPERVGPVVPAAGGDEDPGATQRIFGWIGLGAGVAGGIAAGATAIVTVGAYSRANGTLSEADIGRFHTLRDAAGARRPSPPHCPRSSSGLEPPGVTVLARAPVHGGGMARRGAAGAPGPRAIRH